MMKISEENRSEGHGKAQNKKSAAIKDHFYVVMSFKSIGINTYNVMVFDLET